MQLQGVLEQSCSFFFRSKRLLLIANCYLLPSSSATPPALSAPACPRAMTLLAPYPRPAADQTPLPRPLACRRPVPQVFQEQCVRSGPPVHPILPLSV